MALADKRSRGMIWMVKSAYNKKHRPLNVPNAGVTTSVSSVQGRVSDAYFAKKVVTVAENGAQSVSFERLNSSLLGKTVYLIVQTSDMQIGTELQISVRAMAENERAMPIVIFDRSAVQAQQNPLNINLTNALSNALAIVAITNNNDHPTANANRDQLQNHLTSALGNAQSQANTQAIILLIERAILEAGAPLTNQTIQTKRTNAQTVANTIREAIALAQPPLYASPPNGVISKTKTEGIDVFNDLCNNQGVINYDNSGDYVNNIIIKLQLRPNHRNLFNTVSNTINGLTDRRMYLEIGVRAANRENLYYGDDEIPSARGRFNVRNGDNSFYIENKNFFEIYHRQNNYNFLPMQARIAKLEYNNSDRVIYYYRDSIDNEHSIPECQRTTVMGRNNGTQIQTRPAGHVSVVNADSGGQAQYHYTYSDGSIVTTGNFENPAGSTINPGGYRIMRYTSTGRNVYLIRMPDTLDINISQNAVINYTFSDTRRRFSNPETFAAILGALGQWGLRGFRCTGNSLGNATSYPSSTHANGVSIDTGYTGVNYTPQANLINLVSAFRDWYFIEIIVGNKNSFDYLAPPIAHKRCKYHNDHLHIGICRPNVHVII